MRRFILPLTVAALGLPVAAQTLNASSASDTAASRLPTTAAPIEPAGLLTLETALALALHANPVLSAAKREIQAAQAAAVQAATRPNPVLEATVEDTRRASRETTIQWNQPLELGGKRAARLQVAHGAQAVAKAEFNARYAQLRADVVAAYASVLAAQERVHLAASSIDIAQHAATVALRRSEAGKVSPVEATRAHVAASAVRLELGQAESELKTARMHLASLWGNPSPRFTQASGDVGAVPTMAPLAELESRLASAPALASLRSEVERRQAITQLERSKRIPDLTFSVGVKRSEELGRSLPIVGIAVPLPIFDNNRGNVLEALHRTEQARDELTAARVTLMRELLDAYERWQLARQEADALQEDILPGAQSAYDAATTGFQFGKFSFLDVLDAQRTLLEAKSRYLNALALAHRAAADIERITGTGSAATSYDPYSESK